MRIRGFLALGLTTWTACSGPAGAPSQDESSTQSASESSDGESESESGPGESESGADESETAESETAETETDTGEPELWRSELYPEDWTPGFADREGRFLHDFSWAGYHNGELALPVEIPGVEISVLDHGADPTGETDSTAAIQATIDAVAQAGGGVVQLPAGSYRCDDRLLVSTSGVVIRGDGPDSTFLWFTRTQGMSGQDHLSIRGQLSVGAEYLLAVDGEAQASEVWVADATGLAPGDSVALGWVISEAFIADHAMTGTWMAFNGQWRPS